MSNFSRTISRCLASRRGVRLVGTSAPAAALALAGLLWSAQTCAADLPDALAMMSVGGNYFSRDLAKSKYTILATFIDRATAMAGGDAPAGGMAVFGWFDSGEVRLLHTVAYQPSMLQMMARRNVKPAKFPLDPKATPLYVMACGWPLDDQREPGRITVAYAERDDANIQVKESSVGTLTNLRWIPVPSTRAAKNFQAKEYCGEVAKTKKSSAPLWLTTTTE